MLQPQDLAMTMLAAHLRRPQERVWSGGMVELLGEFGYSAEAARAALSRLVVRGLLLRHREGRLVHYALTARAEETVAEGDRRIFSFGRTPPVARAWTVVWHAIPKDRRAERTQLASQLRSLGFGPLQDATWIAASDREREVSTLVERLSVTGYASILVGRTAHGSERPLICSGAWDFEGLRRRYDEFLRDFAPRVETTVAPAVSDRDAFAVHTRMLYAFRSFPFLDPELPDAMPAVMERRAAAVRTFDALHEQLADAATRYFVEVARAPAPAGRAQRSAAASRSG